MRYIYGVLPGFLGEETLFLVTAYPVDPPALFRGFPFGICPLGRMTLEKPEHRPLVGKIAERSCPACGHHEIGLMTVDGTFHPLKPGTLVQVFPASPYPESVTPFPIPENPFNGPDEDAKDLKPWVPDPVKGIKKLRLKYGVLIPENLSEHTFDAAVYKVAYLHKLEMLIERENAIPLPVILDRFFTAPHLASGNPKDIAVSMWKELDEVRTPVNHIRDWLNHGDEASLGKTADLKKKEDQGASPPGPLDMRKELNALTLEDFLSLLTGTS